MPRYRDPEDTIRKFWQGLQKLAEAEGWTVVRQVVGRSNREFVLRKGTQALPFLVKLSQTERGFWGLTSEQGPRPPGPLVFLTSPNAGYLVPLARWTRLLPRLSRTEGGAIRINEGKLRDQIRFNTLMSLWPQLRGLAVHGSG